MDLKESILVTIRKTLGLNEDDNSFDPDLLMLINSALGILNQNGIGKNILVVDDSLLWSDFLNPEQSIGNEFFGMIPSYVTLSTKVIFDPPPPSAVEYHKQSIDQLLWRLKVAYEYGG